LREVRNIETGLRIGTVPAQISTWEQQRLVAEFPSPFPYPFHFHTTELHPQYPQSLNSKNRRKLLYQKHLVSFSGVLWIIADICSASLGVKGSQVQILSPRFSTTSFATNTYGIQSFLDCRFFVSGDTFGDTFLQ